MCQNIGKALRQFSNGLADDIKSLDLGVTYEARKLSFLMHADDTFLTAIPKNDPQYMFDVVPAGCERCQTYTIIIMSTIFITIFLHSPFL